jgi:phage FluMu gp28-like protein
MLFTEEKIKALLSDFQNIRVWEESVKLNEGMYHQGMAWVIRAIAEK